MVSSLGPCAEAMGISVMMVFAVGVAQLPIMIALALHYPAIRADVYSTAVQVAKDPYTNATAVVWPFQNQKEAGGGFYTHGLNISGLFVLNAASFTFFVVLTMHLLDRHRANSECSNEQEFTRQNVALTSDPSFRTWNQAFVSATLVVHLVVFLTVCSPISIDFILSSSALLYVSLCQLVQPLDNFEEELASSSSSNVTTGAASMAAQTNMLLCMIYGATILFAITHIILDPYMGKTQALLLLACLDAFMLFGHLWDRIPVVQVVMNCRLLYVFMLAVFNMGFFCLWDPYMKTPFMTKL